MGRHGRGAFTPAVGVNESWSCDLSSLPDSFLLYHAPSNLLLASHARKISYLGLIAYGPCLHDIPSLSAYTAADLAPAKVLFPPDCIVPSYETPSTANFCSLVIHLKMLCSSLLRRLVMSLVDY